jgi:Bacterial PH domain
MWWGGHGLRLVHWRITADHAGLRTRSLWRTRQVPWSDVKRVVHTADGELLIRTCDGLDDIRLGAIGWPWLERRLGVESMASRAAAELTAMVRDTRLRPAKRL